VTVNFDPFAAKINSAIVFAVQSGSIGVATLLRGVRAGRIGLHISVPENTSDFKAWAKEMARKPALCLVGDDDGRELGAGAWKGYAYRLARWSSRVVLHCAGAEVSHYEQAIAQAEAGDRVLIIETGTAQAESWLRVLAAVPPRQTQIIWPREGVHPIPDDRQRAH
jgi:hypothetical protein